MFRAVRKDIFIPHLNYVVKVRQFKTPPEDCHHSLAYVQSHGQHGCTLYIDLKKSCSPMDLAHEIVHILQFICMWRNIDFKIEQEHMGYLMQWLMGEIVGAKWGNKAI